MKYTNGQIKKALECCSNGTICKECPFFTTSAKCVNDAMQAALDLINRQEAEKAELQREIASYKSEIENLKLEMSYMKNPNTIGDSHEMGCW